MKPAGRALSVIDYHTEGEPMRIVVGGAEPIPGATLMERSEHLAPVGGARRRRARRGGQDGRRAAADSRRRPGQQVVPPHRPRR